MADASGTDGLIQLWKQHRNRTHYVAMTATLGSSAVLFPPEVKQEAIVPRDQPVAAELTTESEITRPELLFGALVEKGEKTTAGDIIIAVLPAYHWFLEELARDPNAFYQLDPRKFEELIAARYRRMKWDVALTQRTRDGGVDVIATRSDIGTTIRIVDQVKLYAPHHVVGVDAVRELWGVLNLNERGASQGIITTTSRFASGIDKVFADVIPGRLNLRDGDELRKWLLSDIPDAK